MSLPLSVSDSHSVSRPFFFGRAYENNCKFSVKLQALANKMSDMKAEYSKSNQKPWFRSGTSEPFSTKPWEHLGTIVEAEDAVAQQAAEMSEKDKEREAMKQKLADESLQAKNAPRPQGIGMPLPGHTRYFPAGTAPQAVRGGTGGASASSTPSVAAGSPPNSSTPTSTGPSTGSSASGALPGANSRRTSAKRVATERHDSGDVPSIASTADAVVASLSKHTSLAAESSQAGMAFFTKFLSDQDQRNEERRFEQDRRYALDLERRREDDERRRREDDERRREDDERRRKDDERRRAADDRAEQARAQRDALFMQAMQAMLENKK